MTMDFCFGWFLVIERFDESFLAFFMGLLFLALSCGQLIHEVNLLKSPKDLVIGEMIRLEKKEDPETGITYTPIYRYRYKGEEREFRSNISSFTYKKMPLGTKAEILIFKRKTDVIRMNEPLLLLLPTLFSLGMILIAIFLILKGIRFIDQFPQ